MQSCLGIQIENDVIKYAKVQKEKDSIKVEAFNIVFYENLKATIDRIIEETNSSKTPIVLNLTGEKYDYFQIPALLKKADARNSVQLDFDILCEENNYNKNVLETRFLFSASPENPDKVQSIAISANKGDIEQKNLNFSNYKVAEMSSLPISIANLTTKDEKTNIAIINIENATQITTISKGEIVKVDNIDEGMKDILEKINSIENSKQKSYDVCKNTTIYVQDNGEGLSEGNEHMESIMPILYSIVNKAKDIIHGSNVSISKIYITGLATAINNIDLYFQEYMNGIKCEILKPFFADTTSIKTSVKDYIEVNSAIALALDGLGYGFDELNFLPGKAPKQGKMNLNIKIDKDKLKGAIKNPLLAKIQPIEKLFLRLSFVFIIGLIGYGLISNSIVKNIETKTADITKGMTQIDEEVQKVSADIQNINASSEKYQKAINELNALKETQFSTRTIRKLAIPNLMYQLTRITPKYVKILTLENTKDTHIVIEAESKHYEQLGFLYAAISTNGYLTDLKSTSGTKTGESIKVIIEGELP